MEPESQESPRIDELVAELQARVEERRRSGYYPEGLEEDLAEHFQRIVAHRLERGVLPEFRPALDRARREVGFDPTRISTESGLPGGQTLHQTIGRVVGRQVHGILAQVETFGRSTLEALDTLGTVTETLAHELRVDLSGLLDAIHDQLVVQERALAAHSAALGAQERALIALERRVAELEGEGARS